MLIDRGVGMIFYMVGPRDKKVINFFSHSLIISSNNYLQDLESEIALSIRLLWFKSVLDSKMVHFWGFR